LTYSPNKMPGQWKAHGRYIAREAGGRGGSKGERGFGPDGDVSNVPGLLARWQAAGEKRLFKIIISPEFADRLDMPALVRSLMGHMESDQDTRLEWAAVVHRNTDYPHAHVALRGIRSGGQPLLLPRSYIKEQLRAYAEDLCTAQLGFRTELDAADAMRREVTQYRYTSLDRLLARSVLSNGDSSQHGWFTVELSEAKAHSSLAGAACLAKRLSFLETLGLAKARSNYRWQVRHDFAGALKAFQQANDRQRILARHGAIASDPRLSFRTTDLAEVRELYGRVLVHGEEETTGRGYMLLEGTDASIHYILHNTQIQAARRRGQLQPGSFISVRRGRPRSKLTVTDYGDAELLVSNTNRLERIEPSVLHERVAGGASDWGGWLGRFDAAVARVRRAVSDRNRLEPGDRASEGRDRS
jgi:hypothetical protein